MDDLIRKASAFAIRRGECRVFLKIYDIHAGDYYDFLTFTEGNSKIKLYNFLLEAVQKVR
ncbi:hypothetical protein GCM10007063_23510 [Lentibacillus kapialis]|uniref:Uncharacterized protein n=1 Tax=Lentibacillus kapialis TaxID=340214 RepID=A0A917UZM2_9BACI|nr:hypothetical protein GCM10007063_23510 [Lentibacillus kapialis]